MVKVGLVGNPNSGKSTLFNALTKGDAHVGNWPGVTVIREEGIWQEEDILLIDLPGIYSLLPYTPEEIAVERFLKEEAPDCIVQIVDSRVLERSLFLTTWLMELDIPLVIGINMEEAAKNEGILIDKQALEVFIGVKVVSVSPKKKETRRPLSEAIKEGRYGGKREKNFEGLSIKERYEFSQQCCKRAVKREIRQNNITGKLDRFFLHPVWGIPLFFLTMAFVFHFTFGVSFFGTGLPSPGVFLRGGVLYIIEFLKKMVVSCFGQSPLWLQYLIGDGIFGGMGTAVSFLPQILCLFFWLTFLEDSGYMTRAAFLLEKPMGALGLSGKAFLPLLTGFGCSVPAMLGTRILEREESRTIARLIIPFFSCGAKLPLYGVLATGFFPEIADRVIFILYCCGIAIASGSAFFLKSFLLQKKTAPFIMELPAYHIPGWGNLIKVIRLRAAEYITKVGTVIVSSSVLIWFLANFTPELVFAVHGGDSILAYAGRGLAFLFTPLGFGGGEEGYKAVAAILSGFAAKEAVVATLGTLGGTERLFTPISAISFLFFHLLSIPCVAAVSAFWSEEKGNKRLLFALCFWFCTAWIVSFFIYRIGTYIAFFGIL